jgi:uncharacterized membrane protein YfcA
MNIQELSLLVCLGSLLAGFLGALTGLGGGVIIVPLLSLVFKIDIHYAIGASLVSVIATSSGAASAYVREGFTNMRIGMVLEVATVVGALIGAMLAGILSSSVIAVIFGLVLIHSAIMSRKQHLEDPENVQPDHWAKRLRLGGTYPSEGTMKTYEVTAIPGGFGLMTLAGVLSGLLGIGSGAMKVIAMDHVMKMPFKVATTTSNFMIGVTAAASAAVYLHRGYIDPGLSMPVMLGVLIGSLSGAKVLAHAHPRYLRQIFSWIVLLLGLEMIFNGLTGRL